MADSARREAAGRLARHAETRTAMIALPETREALDRAGADELGAPRDLPAPRRTDAAADAPVEDRGGWARRRAEARREPAWATAVNTVTEDRLAAAVAR